MADSLARTKLNVFLSFTTLVCSSICFYDTFFLVLPNASFVVSAEKVRASGIAGAYLFFFFFLQKNTVDCARLQEEAEQWEQFITRDENIQAQAAATQKFWQECPAKISVSCSWRQ